MATIRKTMIWSFLLLGSAGLMAAEETYQKTFTLDKGGLLEVKIDVGSIDVQTWNQNKIEFEAVVRGGRSFVDSFEFSFEDNPRNVRIEGEYPRRNWRLFDGRKTVKVTMRIPEQCSVNFRTSGGNIQVQDLDGDAELRTSGGNLTIQNLSGELIAKTSGGNIRVGSVNGRSTLSTSGGHIYLDHIEGDLEARTSGGNINLDSVSGEVIARTSGGNIRLTVNSPFRGIDASTSGGYITCYMHGDLNADLSAKTSGGSVSVDFPVTIQGKVSRSKIEGKVNNGGPAMRLRTSGGNIKVVQAK